MANMPPRMPVKNPAVIVEYLPDVLRLLVLIINNAMAEANMHTPRMSRKVLIPLSVNQDNEINPNTSPIMLVISIGFNRGPVVNRGDLLR